MILLDDDLHNVQEAEACLHLSCSLAAADPELSQNFCKYKVFSVFGSFFRSEAKAGVSAFHAPTGLNKTAVQNVAELIGLTGHAEA